MVRRGGTPTLMTSEPVSLLSGSTYRITAPARRCVDPNSLSFSTSPATAVNLISGADFLFGEFTVSAGTLASVTAYYIPLGTPEVLAEVKSFSLSETTEMLDRTVFLSGVPLRRKIPGLADATISLELLVDNTDLPALQDIYQDGEEVLLEINTGAVEFFRAWGHIESIERSGSVDGLIEATVNWTLSAQRNAQTGQIVGYSEKAPT